MNCALAAFTPPKNNFPGIPDLITGNFQIYTPQLKVCNQWCSCICHSPQRIRSPHFLDPFCGVFFLGYTGMPVLTPACNYSTCWRRSARIAFITYHFPNWLLGRVISMAIVNKLEPTVSLKMPRVVASNAEIFRLVVIGDVEGIKCLFEQGKASPNDIEQYGGTSVLQVRSVC